MRSRLPTLMTAELEEAREVVPLLRKAAEYEPAEVLQLVDQHWVGDERYLTCALLCCVTSNYGTSRVSILSLDWPTMHQPTVSPFNILRTKFRIPDLI